MHPDLRVLLDQSPEHVARELIGWRLLSTSESGLITTGGIICETEAYLAANDPAAHNKRGKTKANASLFQSSGTIYVHQMRQHLLLDIVTQSELLPGSVLIRGLKPTIGIEKMSERRGTLDVVALCNGPGKLTKALGITKELDGKNLSDTDCILKLLPPKGGRPKFIQTSMRIGVTTDLNEPMRFYADWDLLPTD